MITQAQTQRPASAARPSPVGDLIGKHRELMRAVVWQRHALWRDEQAQAVESYRRRHAAPWQLARWQCAA